jgi:outer membrane receptor protein involved in Fe transport
VTIWSCGLHCRHSTLKVLFSAARIFFSPSRYKSLSAVSIPPESDQNFLGVYRMRRTLAVFVCLLVSAVVSNAQTETATLSGRVTDASGSVVVGGDIQVTNIATNISASTQTNESGLFMFPSLQPGSYRLSIRAKGFREIVKTGIVLNVQDRVAENLSMQVGSVDERVTVTADQLNINTTDATVSTVVDRQFAENLPMNGRSFQTLIYLTPGVVATAVNSSDGGQFSVNGQRPSSNYWMLDGVSANIGISATPSPGNGLGGALGSFSALGGTNSLVSVDAMEEFRIQTSTYAPEFGRTPGGQISILTRSGSNQFHGTAFDYLRNNVFDANNWFADFASQPKPEERQNDFGGTFSGPILKDRTFFFFSYEGLRLRLPQVALDTVPDLAARQTAVSAMQSYLNAFPFDPKQPDLGNGTAQYDASYSNAASLDAYSLRVDQKLNNAWNLFGRYNYSPSQITDRGAGGSPLSAVTPIHITTQTVTIGTTWIVSPTATNDLRFNYSRTNASSTTFLDDFGGATPLPGLPFPTPYTAQDSFLAVGLFALKGGNTLTVGRGQQSLQRQLNFVDGLSLQKGTHSLKFGVDFRRLSPEVDPRLYWQVAIFSDMPSAETGSPLLSEVIPSVSSTFLFRNLGVYAQDTWRLTSRLTATYGLRWDVDYAPTSLNGPNLPAVTGYDLNNLSNLALAPNGTPPFHTTFGNVAPRMGLAYQLSQNQKWQTVLRGGFGIFYDLASSEVGNLILSGYPFTASKVIFGGTFPLSDADAAPPVISPVNLASETLSAVDPHLRLPYALQWNVALEQALGRQQSISASYIGASGRRLLQTSYIFSPNPELSAAQLVGNTAESSYNALQIQFQRRLSRGLQVLSSYTWAHSIDDGSAGSALLGSNTFVPAVGARANRGPSDFDVRNAFSAGVTYNIPAPHGNPFTNAVLRGWSLDNFVIASSAPPTDISYSSLGFGGLFNSVADVRPDIVPGQPLYLRRTQCLAVLGPPCAGGKGFNPAAFAPPPVDPTTGNPLRQGTLGRNALRGFGAAQWDFAVHRDFPIHESVKLQFRAEMFNVLNHPNFGQPDGDLGSPQALSPQFGQSQFMLGQSLSGAQFAGTAGAGSFSPLYQIGGPRSVQFALKLIF